MINAMTLILIQSCSQIRISVSRLSASNVLNCLCPFPVSCLRNSNVSVPDHCRFIYSVASISF